MSRISVAAVLLVSIGLIGGCTARTPGQATAAEPSRPAASSTEGEEPPPSEPASGGGDATQPCALLTGETAGEQFDADEVTATPAEEQSDGNATSYTCEYTGDGEPLGALTVSVFQPAPIDAATMIDAVKTEFSAPKDLPGIGEAAATFEDENARYLASAKIVSGVPVMVLFVGPIDLTVEQLTALVKPTIDQL